MKDNSISNTDTKGIALFTRFRLALANFIVRLAYGRKMTITPFQNSAIAGSVIFWYFENGVRNFVMVKNNKEGKARFVSCLGVGEHSDITEATKQTVKTLLGGVFYKSLDNNLIVVDRVASVPTFKCIDNSNISEVPVNGVVWAVQITPEQAQLCQPNIADIDIIAIPEFAMIGKEVTTSHQMIYQSAIRHIHGNSPLLKELGIDQIDDALKEMRTNSKVIH